MSIVDTIQKLKIQANALMRGIHPDFVLVERKDLEDLLKHHDELQADHLKHNTWLNIPDEYKKSLIQKPDQQYLVGDFESPPPIPVTVTSEPKKHQGEVPHPKLGQGFDDKTLADCAAKFNNVNNFGSEPVPPLEQPIPHLCTIDQFSSRMCEHGTKGCIVNHNADYANLGVGFQPMPPGMKVTIVKDDPNTTYIPMRKSVASDCAHTWLPESFGHDMRCMHCNATRSES